MLLENISDGVYYTDRNRKILYWNKAAEDISGYSASEVVGSHCWDNILSHVDMNGRALCLTDSCPLVKAVITESTVKIEAFLRHKKGHRVPVLIKSMPVRDDKGVVCGAVEIFSDNSAALSMYNKILQLEQRSVVDDLTGIANRRHTEQTIEAQLEFLRREAIPFVLLMIDIDEFKNINDEYGHNCGDMAIRVVAECLKLNVRTYDIVGRWGGDEMVIVAPNIDAGKALFFAERLRMLVENSTVQVPGAVLKVSVTIGIAQAKSEDTIGSLISRVDKMMYAGKRSGKNIVLAETV